MTESLRTLRWSAWLGWQIESNWADLRLFVLYLVVKPVCGSMVLVCMYYAASYGARAVGRRPVDPAYLPYMYVSNACYGLVGTVMFGMSYVVISDRESYRMLKYIFVSPARFRAYFVGRGLARAAEGAVGAAVTLAAGLAVPPVRAALDPALVDLGWLAVFAAIGALLLWACGLILASAMLNMSRGGMFLSEGVAGVVYLLSGVVFPLSVLPGWLQAVGLCLPTTYWLEGMRRAVLGPPAVGSPLGGWSNAELAAALAGTTLALMAAADRFYRHSVRRAWRDGRIEETTGV